MFENQLLIVFSVIFFIGEFFTLYIIVKNKKYAQIVQNIIIMIGIVLLLIFNHALKFPIRNFILIALMITLLGHTLVGQCMDIYHKNIYYDRFLHGFGAFTFALFIYSVLQNVLGPIESPKLYIPYFIGTIGISLGSIFEILEFLIDSISKNSKPSKHQHGLTDTNFDLISDLIGSVIAGIASIYIFI